jgi:hypothetical protein
MQNEKEVVMGQLLPDPDQAECILLDEWRPKHIRKPTWKVQEQMQAKGAAWTRECHTLSAGAKSASALLGTRQEACSGYTSFKKNNELCNFFLDNGARGVKLVLRFVF